MIIVDTNVLSELMRPEPDPLVMAWVAARPASSLFLTTITQAEILYGIGLLPRGRRRSAIGMAAVALFEEDFRGRILPFGSRAASAYVEIAVARRQAGRPISQADAQIAAIARASRAAVATRNIADFAGCGIEVVDPWAG